MTLVRVDLAGMTRLAASKVTINSATTTSFDFGTPDDIDLRALSAYSPGDRVLVILTASTAGTTNNLTWVIQDAEDNGSGAIGTPATAVTSVVAGALAATTGDDYSAFAVHLQPDRPWLRIRVTSDGNTDTIVTHCSVYGVPSGV